jgi:phosphoglycerate dehydrogenase-like enzyme
VTVWTEADQPPAEAVEALLAWRLKPGVAACYPKLRVVCSLAAGVDKLLAAPDLPPQVPVTRVVDPLQAQAIAQYVLAVGLRHLREMPLFEAQQARAEWRRRPQRSLCQCRVGLLGQGEVAQAVAKGFGALGLPVALWGRSTRPLPALAGLPDLQRHAGDEGLVAMLARTDLLVCTLPLTEATRGLLNRERLQQLPQGAYVVNVGRGEQLVEADLRALLDEGHLAGAALDVFEREPPPPDSWVWHHPKVFASPHIAGEARDEVVAAACLDALRRARAGLPQPLAVDRAAGY